MNHRLFMRNIFDLWIFLSLLLDKIVRILSFPLIKCLLWYKLSLTSRPRPLPIWNGRTPFIWHSWHSVHWWGYIFIIDHIALSMAVINCIIQVIIVFLLLFYWLRIHLLRLNIIISLPCPIFLYVHHVLVRCHFSIWAWGADSDQFVSCCGGPLNVCCTPARG